MRGRIYDPELRRFTTPDPFVSEVHNPQGLNRYAYVMNNPMNYVDPSGYWFIPVAVAVGAYIFGDDDTKEAVERTVAGTVAGGLKGGPAGAVYGGATAFLAGASPETRREVLDVTLRVGEGALLAALGGGIGVLGGYALGSYTIGGSAGAFLGGGIGSINGAIGGYTRSYSLDFEGALTFGSDSSWNLVGTGAGLAYFGVNIASGADYSRKYSERQNRHVFFGGATTHTANTFGNVIAFRFAKEDIGNPRVISERDFRRLLKHEGIHIFQQRLLGPVQVGTVAAWGTIAGGAGALYGWAAGDDDIQGRATLWGYYYSPLELWAYMANWDAWRSGQAKQREKF